MNVRDWINVYDNCEAIEIIFNESKAGEFYNVGANNEGSKNLQMINHIHNIISKNQRGKKTYLLLKIGLATIDVT